MSVQPGVYQLTDADLALEATVKGTKCQQDDELNSFEVTRSVRGSWPRPNIPAAVLYDGRLQRS